MSFDAKVDAIKDVKDMTPAEFWNYFDELAKEATEEEILMQIDFWKSFDAKVAELKCDEIRHEDFPRANFTRKFDYFENEGR